MNKMESTPTLEERVADLEKNTAESIQNLNANVTILLGVTQSQGQDIKRILYRMNIMDGRLDIMGGRLGILDQRVEKLDNRVEKLDNRLISEEQDVSQMEVTLNEHTSILTEHTATLNEHTSILTGHTARFDRVENLLAQILTRLPEQA